MKRFQLLLFSLALLLLPACTFYSSGSAAPASAVKQPKPLVVPVSKNWQVTEEPPMLSDERGRLPFQTEQSVQPAGAKPVSPANNRTIETTR